jgi:transaldolase
MIKIPATPAGLPAIQQSIADGMNVNVTLIFSQQRYIEVMDAYLAGLEECLAAGKPVKNIASVASFFVSRVDSLVEQMLDEKIQAGADAEKLNKLKGLAAIANAKLAYAVFKKQFAPARFQKLAREGARVQRPLWASTSTKNPAYPDIYYVEALIGPDTVNTMPPQTIMAYKDHGQPALRLEDNVDEARRTIANLEAVGIRMQVVTQQLETEGVAAFNKSFDMLMKAVKEECMATEDLAELVYPGP